mgnify:CR=1 FL=1
MKACDNHWCPFLSAAFFGRLCLFLKFEKRNQKIVKGPDFIKLTWEGMAVEWLKETMVPAGRWKTDEKTSVVLDPAHGFY